VKQRVSEVSLEVVPSLLTVDEAARVLRVGRTKAYAMAQEWRATGGRSGLPVIDFGNVLRVPRYQLETLLGGPLTPAGIEASNAVVEPEADAGPTESGAQTDEPDATTEQATPVQAPDPVNDANDPTTRRPRRRPQLSQSNQPSLFDSLPD